MKLYSFIILLGLALGSCEISNTDLKAIKSDEIFSSSSGSYQTISDLNLQLMLPHSAEIIGKGDIAIRSMDPTTFDQATWEEREKYFEMHVIQHDKNRELREIITQRCMRSEIIKEHQSQIIELIYYQNHCSRFDEYALRLDKDSYIIQSGIDTTDNTAIWNVLMQARAAIVTISN